MPPVVAVGDVGFLVQTGPGAAVALWRALRDDLPAGVVDVVAGSSSVLLLYDAAAGGAPVEPPVLPDPDLLHPPRRHQVSVPVAYDGPDLAEVAHMTGLTEAEVAAAHCGPEYSVSFVGFSPGFAYLAGTDPRLDVPRLDRPRTSVPAGSVAVAAGLTAVYPQATPGGWRLIGRTDVALFDPTGDPPSLLAPGDLVRFHASRSIGTAPEWPVPSLLAGDPRGPRLEVLDAGARLTVQDRGRPGWAHAGVPRGGAADSRSAARANALVGNRPAHALLEATLGGCRLRLLAERTVAVTGAPGQLSVDGLPARHDAPLRVPAGSEMVVGPAERGVHTYLAFGGGIDVEAVLGSRSRDTLSGLGPPPLVRGDVVGLGPSPADVGAGGGAGGSPGPAPDIAGPGSVQRVQGRPGPDVDALGPEGLRSLASAEWTVGADSDRTGARLIGPVLPGAGSVTSAGMVAGAVQLPPGGQPVVLLRNHPPTGGYPVVAVIDDAGVDVLSQCRPGIRIRIELS